MTATIYFLPLPVTQRNYTVSCCILLPFHIVDISMVSNNSHGGAGATGSGRGRHFPDLGSDCRYRRF